MRATLLAIACSIVLSLSAYLGAKPQNAETKVRIRLLDDETGKGHAGLIRVFRKDENKPITLSGLFDRLRGLQKSDSVAGWYVVPKDGSEVTLPRAALRLEAVSGLETGLTRQEEDLTGGTAKEITLKLNFLFRPEKLGLIAGNTHLHLRNLTRDESDDYLRQIPTADGLQVMFISYLERFKDDQDYITNKYPIGDLQKFEATGVLFNNGEEHRHNFEGYNQGYGHVMLLNIKQLVKPVSIGPGIMGTGNDEPSLSIGIEDARRQGGTVIWCHNTFGYESVPNALAGRLDALNVFDGSRTGTFDDKYYRLLNVGQRLPISTGTDWFMYDFARVYARVAGKLTIPSWLEAVKAGRCQATNGPLLTLTVDGKDIGDVLNVDKPRTVRVEATGRGRHSFQQLQLVHNGQIIHREAAEAKDGVSSARMVREIMIDRPGWFAVRIETQTKNELDRQLYAHTSPVYVDFAGRRVFGVESARALLRNLEEAQANIRARGKFSDPQVQEKVLAVYEQAAKDLTARVNERAK